MVWEVRSTGSDSVCSGGFRGGAVVATPSAPVVTGAASGGTVAANTYWCVITLNDGYGETAKSAETSVVLTGTTSKFTVTAPAAGSDKSAWNLYVATASGGPYWSQGSTLVLGVDRVVVTTPPTSGTQAPGVDRSQSDTAQVNVNNSTITATTAGANSNVITFTGYAPTAADVGNTFSAASGANITVGIYEITAWTATTWTVTGANNLTGAGGAGSAIVGKMGGALASPGKAAGFLIASNKIHVKSATYLMSASTNVSGGSLAVVISAWYGYQTTRLDRGTKPIFLANANSVTCLNFNSASGNIADNVETGNNGAFTSCTGFANSGSVRTRYTRCKSTSLATGFNIGSLGYAERCYTSACTTGFNINGRVFGCVANTGTTGFSFAGTGTHAEWCIATACAGAGFNMATNGTAALNCVAYGCTGANGNGFSIGAVDGVFLANCIAEGNAAFGFTNTTWDASNVLVNCFGFNNTSGNHDLPPAGVESFTALTVSPFTSAAGNDFSLNTTTGGGAGVRAAGVPSSYLGLSTTSALDGGAAQHADPVAAAAILSMFGRSIGTY